MSPLSAAASFYMRSQAAGERVLASVTKYLEEELKLRVNRAKNAVASVMERKFLGHRLLVDGTQTIAPKSLDRARDRVRSRTVRSNLLAGAFLGPYSSVHTGSRIASKNPCPPEINP
jgi:hypothetical protein